MSRSTATPERRSRPSTPCSGPARRWRPTCRGHRPVLVFRSTEDHVVDDSSVPLITARVSSRDVTERVLTDSYHVATLDNDAPTIFEESAEFIARVTGSRA